MNALPYDIAIVGGGITGAALALLLAPLRWRIALIEAQNMAADQGAADFDERALALSRGSELLLRQLDLWPTLQAHAAPIRHIHVSDRGHFGHCQLHAEEYAIDALGQVIELRALSRVLLQAVRARNVADIIAPARVLRMDENVDSTTLTLESGAVQSTLLCHWVFAADGVQSLLRKQAGMAVQVQDYQQTALVANVATSRAVSDVAYERFTTQGPLALLPLPQSRWSLVWSLTPELAAHYLQADEREFLAGLQQAFGWRAGQFIRSGKRMSFPLQRIHSPQRRQGRLLLLGNAAHQLHPIAGQGFNLALRDVAALAAQLCASGLCDVATLDAFLHARRADAAGSLMATDTLVKLFSHDMALTASLRGLLLEGMQAHSLLRGMLAQRAMGLRA